MEMAPTVLTCLFVVMAMWIQGFFSTSSQKMPSSVIPGCENNNELDNCMERFLPSAVGGIPSNREDTEITCRVFNSSMNCVQHYVRKCNFDPFLESVLNASINPTIEMYKKICKDERSMATFYRYGACHKKVTPGYLKCSDRYAQLRSGLTYARNNFEICCHQINFMGCVDKVIRLVCAPDAYNAVINLAKEAVQFSSAEMEVGKECSMVNFIRCPHFGGNGNTLLSNELTALLAFIYLRVNLFIL